MMIFGGFEFRVSGGSATRLAGWPGDGVDHAAGDAVASAGPSRRLCCTHGSAAAAPQYTATTFPGGPKSQKPMDGRQKPFCGENKVDYPLGFCSGMPKPPRIFDSDSQNDDFWGF